MKFKKQGIHFRVTGLAVGIDGLDVGAVEDFDTGYRDAHLYGLDSRLGGAADVRKIHSRRRNRLGQAIQAQADLGDDAERALGTDEQARQVITGRGFARARAGTDDFAIGQYQRQAENIFAHGTVAHRVGARGPRCCHATYGGIGARVYGEKQTAVAQVLIQFASHHPGLNAAIHVFVIDFDDLVHLA